MEEKPSPLIKLYVKPYQGTRASPTNAIYSVLSSTTVRKLTFINIYIQKKIHRLSSQENIFIWI